MKFQILSRENSIDRRVVDKVCSEPYIWISITDKDETHPAIKHNENCVAVLKLNFDDVVQKWPEYTPPDENDAKQIVDFVDKHIDQVDVIVVNCEAGISRSSATALALSVLIDGHDHGIGRNRRYDPNPLLVDLIIRNGHKLKIKNKDIL